MPPERMEKTMTPNASQIKCKGRMCLIRKFDDGLRKSKGGIIIPETTKNPVDFAEVLAVGPGLINEETGKRMPVDVEKGEHVMVPRYAGTEVTVCGEKLVIIPAPEIMAEITSHAEPVSASGLCVGGR